MKKRVKNIDLRKRDRGACLLEVGKERFNFDSKSEFVKYKFLCCETMKISEWKKCREYSYSYYEWSQEIKNRFAKYNVRQLAEFEKYLELCIRKKTILSDSSNIIYAALIKSFPICRTIEARQIDSHPSLVDRVVS